MASTDGDAEGDAPTPGPITSDDAYGDYFSGSFDRHVAWVQKDFDSLDRQSAEDVVAEAFKLLYPSRADIAHPDAAFSARIRGLALDQIAKRHKSIDDSSVVGHAEALTTDNSPPDSAYASQECRDLFSAEAVATLDPEERKLYDFYLEEKTHPQIAQITGMPVRRVKEEFKEIFVKLFDAMAKLVTLDTASLGGGELKSPRTAEKAISRLPRLLSAIVRLTYVDKLPAAQIAVRLQLASANEVARHLERALSALGRMYRVKMPDALVAALAYKPHQSLGGKEKA
jgi:DNA-directed RNA polymerase specialized sigma24 family protein